MLQSLLTFVILLILSVVVSSQSDEECGKLHMEYYYNQKKLTQIGEFPWMGRALYENQTDKSLWWICDAVLIGKQFVLMNAWCFSGENEPVKVQLGAWNTASSLQKRQCDASGRCAPAPILYEIDEIIIHSNYNSKLGYNDIALVKLDRPVTYSDYIRPICMPSKDVVQLNFDNQLLEVTGWYFDSTISEILAKTNVRIVNLKTCEATMRDFTLDKANNICAYTCSDDYVFSHGTVLMNVETVDGAPGHYYFIGLKIHGVASCSLAYPDVFIRVDRYLDWIKRNMV